MATSIQAAGARRHQDVCIEIVSVKILEQIKARRQEAREPHVAVHQEPENDFCEAKIDQLIQEIASRRNGAGKRRFGRQSKRYLAPVVKKSFQAATADLNVESLAGDKRMDLHSFSENVVAKLWPTRLYEP